MGLFETLKQKTLKFFASGLLFLIGTIALANGLREVLLRIQDFVPNPALLLGVIGVAVVFGIIIRVAFGFGIKMATTSALFIGFSYVGVMEVLSRLYIVNRIVTLQTLYVTLATIALYSIGLFIGTLIESRIEYETPIVTDWFVRTETTTQNEDETSGSETTPPEDKREQDST